jgi:hypothetical protein
VKRQRSAYEQAKRDAALAWKEVPLEDEVDKVHAKLEAEVRAEYGETEETSPKEKERLSAAVRAELDKWEDR